MSFTLNTHRPTEPDSLSMTLPVIPWSAEYDWQGNGSANETTLNSMATGRTYPSSVTFQSNPVGNVYQGSNLATSPQRLPNKTGTKIYLNNTEVWSKLSSDDPSYEALMPVVGSIMLKVPNDPLVTPAVVLDFLLRTVATLLAGGTGVLPEEWLARLLIGSTNPTLSINT